jgi:lysophospholipase L1-like esterase
MSGTLVDAVGTTGTWVAFRETNLAYYGLGDSVAAGHGLPGQSPDCKRAPGAYPNLVARNLAGDLDIPYDSVAIGPHLACSGAKSSQIINQVQSVLNDLSEKRQNQSTDALVSITIGANDFPWTNLSVLGQWLCSPQSEFDAQLNSITSGVRLNVLNAIQTLINEDDVEGHVYVVVTDYHNPYNMRSSILRLILGPRYFTLPPGSIPRRVPNPFYQPRCQGRSVAGLYARSEDAVHALNETLQQTADSFRADRVRLASVHTQFHGHESPRPICGAAPPKISNSWVQSPDDLNLPEPGDDCFHPNARGAEEFAKAVHNVARQLLISTTP